MIAVVPLATALTKPEEFTVAVLVLVDDQVNVLPEIELPFASVTLAVSCTVSPSDTRVAEAGVTTTLETACATVSDAEPETPSTVAVIAVVPLATAATNPEEFTVAVLVLVDDQVNVLFEMVLPEPSLATAVNCCVAPSAVSVLVLGVT